jgi:hypothetical protein
VFLILIAGIAVAVNFIFIKFKFEHERYADGFVDLGTLMVLAFLFSGTMTGEAIAMVASAIISVYLWFNPPNIDKWVDIFDKEFQ